MKGIRVSIRVGPCKASESFLVRHPSSSFRVSRSTETLRRAKRPRPPEKGRRPSLGHGHCGAGDIFPGFREGSAHTRPHTSGPAGPGGAITVRLDSNHASQGCWRQPRQPAVFAAVTQKQCYGNRACTRLEADMLSGGRGVLGDHELPRQECLSLAFSISDLA